MVLTGPLILANVVFSVVFSRLFGGFSYLGYYSNFITAIVWGLVMAILGFIISVFVFSFLAGMFKGKSDFPRAFAAISLAAIPAWIGGILAAILPSVGFLLALAGGIISLVFMYKIMPLALTVPDEKRKVHFIASVVAIVILNAIVGGVLGMGNPVQRGSFSRNDTSSRTVPGSGVLGEIERQGRLMDAAGADVYEPPADGELNKGQVEDYIKVMKKTHAASAEYAEKIQKLADEMKAKEQAGKSVSPADIAKMYSGYGSVVSANNAELEVVKTGRGNWAEHQWVKEQLRVARIQQGDGSDAIAHNYELYRKYEDDLQAVN